MDDEGGTAGDERAFALFHGGHDVRTLREQLARRGALGTVGWVLQRLPSRLNWQLYYNLHRLFDRAFDRRHGVDTCGVSFLSALSVRGANRASGLEYEPTPVRGFARMLRSMPGDLSSFTFIDFGCGKGRTLMLAASQFDFRRVVGVEFAAELHSIAIDNVARFKASINSEVPIDVVHSDASEFEIPDGPCVFYFYYPFREPVMRRVLQNIADSHTSEPRPMFFVNRLDKPEWSAECERIFASFDFVGPQPVRTRTSLAAPFEVLVYTTAEAAR